jgi:hypothetical protein
VFVVRAYMQTSEVFVEAKRSFTISAPPPG